MERVRRKAAEKENKKSGELNVENIKGPCEKVSESSCEALNVMKTEKLLAQVA